MNRLSPLISRRARSIAIPVATASYAIAQNYESSGWLADLRIFATGWAGGLVFFGTLLG